MKALKNSTALVVALGLMTPHYGLAQGTAANIDADIAAAQDALGCITKGIADGMSEQDANAACQTNGGAAQGESSEVAENGTPDPVASAEADVVTDVPMDSEAQDPTMSEADAQAAAEAAITTQDAPIAEAPARVDAPETPVETFNDAAPAEIVPEANETVAPEVIVEAPEVEPPVLEAPEVAPTEQPTETTAAPEEIPTPEASEQSITGEAVEASALPEPEMSIAAEAAAQMLEQALEVEASDGAPLAAAALAEAPQDDAAAPMIEETVTEDTARSSSEDFSNKVSEQAKASNDEKKGLTNLEKAALAGLAALAVGAVLKNGSEVAVNSGDRVVLQDPDGSYRVIKDDGALLRQPGTTVRTQNFSDGSSRTVSTRPDGAEIVTIYDSQKRIIKRTRIEPNGDEYVLVDDSRGAAPIEVTELPQVNVTETVTATNRDALAAALARQAETSRSFTLSQVRQFAPVRALAPAVTVDNVTFASGSAAIRPEQAKELAMLGTAIRERIAQNPREVFLVEGHTDAVGSAAFNLALSDRRAESLALALTEYFDVPSENLVIQGYGEEYLKIATDGPEEENRRATVRRITDLLRTATAE